MRRSCHSYLFELVVGCHGGFQMGQDLFSNNTSAFVCRPWKFPFQRSLNLKNTFYIWELKHVWIFKNHGFPMNCPFQNLSKLKQLAQGAWTRRAASCWTCCSACSPCATRTCNASARGSTAWKRPRPRTAASARRRCWEMAAMAAMASMPGMLGLN